MLRQAGNTLVAREMAVCKDSGEVLFCAGEVVTSTQLERLVREVGNDNIYWDVYDREGYDRNGYDRAGYDREGFGRDGFDRGGFDRGGWDSEGYGRDGLDSFGFDRSGENSMLDRNADRIDGYDRDDDPYWAGNYEDIADEW